MTGRVLLHGDSSTKVTILCVIITRQPATIHVSYLKGIMTKLALPCIKCNKPLINVDESCSNQPHVGTEFTTLGHYGSTIHDEMYEDSPLELVVNICDTCILRAIEAGVIQSRGKNETKPLLANHHLDDRLKAYVLAQNEKQYGSAWGDDTPQNYNSLMMKVRESNFLYPTSE
jgi:hypothetical protein